MTPTESHGGPTEHSPGANANMAKDSPDEATEVTRARCLEKYCARRVTVGRKAKQQPKPVDKGEDRGT